MKPMKNENRWEPFDLAQKTKLGGNTMTMFNLLPISTSVEMSDCGGGCKGCRGCDGCDGCRDTTKWSSEEEGGV